MTNTELIILYASAAGFPIIIGGTLSSIIEPLKFDLKKEINHWIVAFGGGALLSAVAFALIPEALPHLSLLEIIIVAILGCLGFMGIDQVANHIGGSVAQVIAMMMDFIPEALSLGASFAVNPKFGLLLAVFIGVQNLPEGYNSYRDLRHKLSKKATLLLMFGLSFVGIFAAIFGELILSTHPKAIAMIMLFAGSGIIYLIFQDIAPMSKKVGDYIPATGACIGFLVGIIGQQLM